MAERSSPFTPRVRIARASSRVRHRTAKSRMVSGGRWIDAGGAGAPALRAAAKLRLGALSPVLELPDGFVILKRIQ